MKTLRLMGATLIQMVQAVRALPKTIAEAMKQRGQRTILRGLEAERLDRIRNPSKYRGK